MCIHNSLRGNMREQDVNRWGRRPGWGVGGAVCEEGWEPCWVHRVHWRGLTHSSASCSLSLSFSLSLSTMVDLNNLSHIIYLSTSLTRSLPHTNTLVHTQTRNYLPLHTNAHIHTCLRGLGPGAGVEWASWNLHRGKPDRHSLCQTHEVTLTDWSCLPASLPPSLQCRHIKTLYLFKINYRT